MSNKKTMDFNTFIRLLKELDNELLKINNIIEIKAIGGFPAIYHAKENKILGRQKSSNIDNLNKLSEETKQIISKIGKKNNVEED